MAVERDRGPDFQNLTSRRPTSDDSHVGDMVELASRVSAISRREALGRVSLASLSLLLPVGFWGRLSAQPHSLAPTRQPRQRRNPPVISFARNRAGDGVVGPYGEVRLATVGDETLPVYVSAGDGSAVMDMTLRSPYVRFGAGTTAVTLTSRGAQFGKSREVAWSAATVRRLIAALARDREHARSALLLRSALHTSYPVALAQKRASGSRRIARTMAKGAAGYSARAMQCTTRTVTDTVVDSVTELVAEIRTAEELYQACYDREASRGACAISGPAAGACAAVICAAKPFVDLVVGWVEVVSTTVEEVTREVVSCVGSILPGTWPNPWSITGHPVRSAVPQPAMAFTAADLSAATKLLETLAGFLGPFGKCLLAGRWELAQLRTPLDLGGGPITLPYGVKVCVDATCATQLSADNIGSELVASWGAALSVLAALSPAFAAEVAGLGISAAPAVAAVVAGVSPVVASAAAVVLAFIVLTLVYGTAISAQLYVRRSITNDFADGTVCIEHPTFALALIKLTTLVVPAELIPPIVTG